MTESNGAYSTKIFINSILQFSFAEKYYISREHLNRIAYVVAEEYSRATGSPIIDEKFDYSTLSPSLNSVNRFYCRCFEQNYIDHYVHDDGEKVMFISEPIFQKIAKSVWRDMKAMSLTLLVERVNSYQTIH